jgi:hypothetical protein
VWDSGAAYLIRLAAFHALDFFAGKAIERAQFQRAHGYPLKLENPESYNEKIIWKKHFDRNPLLPVVTDKLRVRKYIETLLGKERAAEILIPLLYATDSPETIPFGRLPRSFALKANHSCGMNYLVHDKDREDPKKLIALCRSWLRHSYGVFKYQWAYQGIPRRILVEELLAGKDGKPPCDYKFFMIHGRCRMIRVDVDRFAEHTINMYDCGWNPLDLTLECPCGELRPRPKNLKKMLRLAEELAQDFDHIRVDLYDHDTGGGGVLSILAS